MPKKNEKPAPAPKRGPDMKVIVKQAFIANRDNPADKPVKFVEGECRSDAYPKWAVDRLIELGMGHKVGDERDLDAEKKADAIADARAAKAEQDEVEALKKKQEAARQEAMKKAVESRKKG